MQLEFSFSTYGIVDFYVERHFHHALEIVYCLEGTGKTVLGDRSHKMGPNRFLVIPAGVAHDERRITPMRTICLGLTSGGLHECAGAWSDRDGQLRMACELLVAETSRRRPEYESVVRGLLAQIAALVRRAVQTHDDRLRPPDLVDRAMEIIRSRHGQLSVADLSRHLFVGKDYLRHLFQEYADGSPMRHIIQERISFAQQLLRREDVSIKEVARQCGFESAYYFSRLFKQVTGQTPTEFRRELVRERQGRNQR